MPSPPAPPPPSRQPNSFDLKTGNAFLETKKDGSINVKGKTFNVATSGDTSIKASGALTLKGSRVLQN